MDDMQEKATGTVPEGQGNTGITEQAAETTAEITKRPWYKVPVITIPAILALLVMVYVFLLTGRASLLKYSAIRGMSDSPYIGFKQYEYVLNDSSIWMSIWATLLTKLTVLAVCTGLAAGMCAIYRKMKKTGMDLTAACLWLVPVAIPTAVPAVWSVYALKFAKIGSNELLFLAASGLQTLGIFCFVAGLFAYLKKNPFTGLLTAALVYLLGSISTSAIHYSFWLKSANQPMDTLYYYYSTVKLDIGRASAMSVVRIALQVLIGILPLVLLCKKTRRESAPVRSTRGEIVSIPVAMVCAALACLAAGLPQAIKLVWFRTAVNSLLIALAGGVAGGVIAYSFVRLLSGISRRMYAVAAVILSATMTCIITLYMMTAGMWNFRETLMPVLYAAFDWRMILLVLTIAFILRSHTGSRPFGLVFALGLLAAAFTWGNATIGQLYTRKNTTVGYLFLQSIKSYETWKDWNPEMSLLTALPPLLMGIGAAFLMKKAFKNIPEKE